MLTKMLQGSSRQVITLVSLVASLGIISAGCAGEMDSEIVTDDGDIVLEPTAESIQSLVYNGHDYQFVQQAATYSQASAICQFWGYHLVRIDNKAEEDWLAAQEVNYGGANDQWWIGINDIALEGVFRWNFGGSSYSYSNWASGEPNNKNGNEDCGADNYGTYGKWNDRPCDAVSKYICEFE